MQVGHFHRLRIHWIVLLLLGGLLAACGGSDKPKAANLPHLFEDDVVLAFGDSLTYGTGAKTSQSYPAVLESLINRRVINAGVPGETTAGGLKRLPATLEEHQPELVLLCLGGNDFLRKMPLAQTRKNLGAMLELLKNNNIPVVLIGVPEIGIGVNTAPFYKELANQHNAVLAEDVMADVLSSGSLKSDRIHPNARGYRQIAEALAELLDNQGAL